MSYFYNNINELNNLEPRAPKEPGKKVGIVDIFVSAVIKNRDLPEVAMNSEKRFALYVVFISLFVAFLTFLMPIGTMVYSVGGLDHLIKDTVPSFTVKNGMLEAETPFRMKLGNTYVLINTHKESFGADDLEKAGVYVTFGSKKATVSVVNDDGIGVSYTEMSSVKIGELFSDGYTNEDLLNIIPVFYVSIFFVFIFIAAFTAAKYLLAAVFYMILSLPMLLLCQYNLSTKDSFRLSFYAQTIGIIIVSLYTSLISGSVSMLASIAGMVITYFVIQKALRPRPSDSSDMFGGYDDDDDDSDD